MIAVNRPLRPCFPARAFACERREDGRSPMPGVLQKLALKVLMQRKGYWFFRFARCESDDLVGPVNRVPSHVGYVTKSCAGVVAEQNCASPIASRPPASFDTCGVKVACSSAFTGRLSTAVAGLLSMICCRTAALSAALTTFTERLACSASLAAVIELR